MSGGRTGLAQTGVVTYTLWCDEGRTPTKRLKLDKRFEAIVQKALAFIEAELEKGRYHVSEKLAKGLADGTDVASADRAKARQFRVLAEGIRRNHEALLAAIVPERAYLGRWWFGTYTGKIELRFDRAQQRARPVRNPLTGATGPALVLTPAVKARVYDPRLPPEYKELVGAVEFDKDRMDYVIRVRGGTVGINGFRTRTPDLTRNYLLKSEARVWDFTVVDGEIVGRMMTGDRFRLIPTDHDRLKKRLVELDGLKTPFETPETPRRATALPASLLPELGKVTPSPLRWSRGELRRFGATGEGRAKIAFTNVNQVVFSHTGTSAYVVQAGTTYSLNAHLGKEKYRSRTGSPIAVARTNQVIAVPNATGTKVFDATNGEYIKIRFGKSSSVATFSPDGQRLIVGSRLGELQVFARGGKRLVNVKHSNAVNAIAISPDSKRAYSAVADKSINIWDVTNKGKFLGAMKPTEFDLGSLRVSPDGKLVMGIARVSTGGGQSKRLPVTQFEIQIWDVERKTRVFTTRIGHSATSIDVSPDWRYAIVGEKDGPLALWDLTEGVERYHLIGHTRPANNVRFSSDGRFVISGGSDGWVIIWGMPQHVFVGEQDPPNIARKKQTKPKEPPRALTAEERKMAEVRRTLKLAEAAIQTGKRVRAARFLQQAERLAGKNPVIRREIERIRELF